MNHWFVLFVRSLSFLFAFLAASVLLSLVNPVLPPEQAMQYMTSMMQACQSGTLMSSMMRQLMGMSGPAGGWSTLFWSVTLVSFGLLPLSLIVGCCLRKRLGAAK
ncbi:hypothetical protein [Paenibacillus turpanensis]|uniref:hypothetical protein n=1 Tax=Paenibacillus turpanensis TaxID=2689078 RepID=UPI00140B1730|nr:hypothetical protein [Paenibacillus turpanensis]